MKTKLRAREMGLPFSGKTGANNNITDVAGVQVGYKTLIDHENSSQKQTGVTAILPRGRSNTPQPVWAGMYALNGNGEMTGTHWIQDGGYFTGPIMITNSHAVGITHHAAVKWTINQYKEAWTEHHLWAMPVVAETFDGILNDINAMHVTEQDAQDALDNAQSGPIQEGNVGGGTGMIAYDYKGGTGSSSRLIKVDGREYTVGALVQANHGVRKWFNVLGAPFGLHDNENLIHPLHEQGSIIVVIATDAPMLPHQLKRMAKRAAIGIGRNGSPGGNNSGDIFLAFSTANSKNMPQLSESHQTMDYLNDEVFDDFYLAVVESIEEAVINAMFAADDVPVFKMAESEVCRAIDTQKLCEFVSASRVMG
ncbi:P1 family peptidase [Marinomonas mediterranea]|uniref:DmpA family aminopeptidase n=1 Tax=Marinomonas mediterranea TaxID=119864 RepID=UPI00234BBFEF|nr:P1 family peptidase [Marinomonas mediterranea]WCN08916.1 S58 family peptidase [Marinomonas mediterranea]